MNTRIIAAAAASLMATSGAALAADDALSYALSNTDAEALSLSLNSGAGDISIGVQSQTRYQINIRDDSSGALGDNDTTIGFVQRRTKVWLKGDVTEDIKGKVVFAFDRDSGAANLEDAYFDWAVSDGVTLRLGQFKLPVLREESISSSRQLSADRSAMNETFNQDRSQGIMAMFGGDNWRGGVAFSDGANSDNTDFNNAAESDFSISARADFKFGDADWKAFDQFTSWRGSAQGFVVGAAVHWQTMGETNPAAAMETDALFFTADAQFVSDGWNAFGAFVFRNVDNGTTDFDDLGAIIQAGVFLSDTTEIFGRWDGVFADSDRGASVDDFNSLTFGLNHYLVPESHAAKLTLAVSVSLDEQSTSIVSANDGINLLADADDGQIGIIGQAQFLF